jgi:hypothetical protein
VAARPRRLTREVEPGLRHPAGAALDAQRADREVQPVAVAARDEDPQAAPPPRSLQVLMSITVLLGLLSQLALDVVGDPALARRLVSVWGTPNMTGAMLEAYARCFKTPLEALAAR